jgi:hypothetical protein
MIAVVKPFSEMDALTINLILVQDLKRIEKLLEVCGISFPESL